VSSRESYLAARVLDALLREDYGRLSSRVARSRDGVGLRLADGRLVRLAPGALFQDFVVAPGQALCLEQVLQTLTEIADPKDAAGVSAFFEECVAALTALELHDAHLTEVLARKPPYESLAAFADHPVYPTSRARPGLSEADLLAYAPEFAPVFPLRWAEVPRGALEAGSAERLPEDVLPGGCAERPAQDVPPGGSAERFPEDVPPGGGTLFPVHPLAVAEVRKIDGVRVLDEPRLRVRPTLSMRTVEVSPRTHLKLPLPTSTLGARNRRSIKAGTLRDGARAELLLRELADPGVLIADEQTYAHAGHDYLAWMVRRIPAGTVVPVAALAVPGVLAELDETFPGVRTDPGIRAAPGGRAEPGVPGVPGVRAEPGRGDPGGRAEPVGVLPAYLRLLLRWNVRLFVKYGVALEAHQQNLALVFTDGEMKLLVKDNDGLLASPARLAAAGVAVPEFADARMLTDDPHALADVFVTITLHLASAAVVFGVLPHAEAAALLRGTLAEALDAYGGDPMARLLRARTLDAARLTGKSMVTAGTLVAKERSGARDVNKFYGTSGPNYLRRA